MLGINNKNIIEIIWYSRGGQGAKTSALLFGEASLACGYYMQVFPEYGPERAGAPMRVYNRISENFIRHRTPIEKPDIVVVLDQTLLNKQIFKLYKSPAIFLINSPKECLVFKNNQKIRGKVLTIDASNLAQKYLGKSIPSIVMLGALAGLLKFDLNKFLPGLKIRISEKLDENLITANIKIIKKSYKFIRENQ